MEGDLVGQPLVVPASELAAALLGLWQGLMLQRLTDPESTPPGSVGAAMAWLQRGAAHPAGQPQRP